MRFALTKWYVDVVTADGRVAIAYWASVRAAGVSHAVSGLLRSAGGPAPATFSLRPSPAPAVDGSSLRWQCDPLHVELEAHRLERPCFERLLDTGAGAVDWHVEAPRARVRLRAGADTFEGLGYAERLELTVPPWTLPLETLAWGRWVSPDHSVVWVTWQGPEPRRVAFVDGERTGDVVAEGDGVCVAGSRLALATGREITRATVGEQLGLLGPLQSLVARVAGSRQTRWLSRGVRRGPEGGEEAGWAVHEVVDWR